MMRSASAPRARGGVARTAWLCASFGVISRAQLIFDVIFVSPTDCYTSELVGYDFKVLSREEVLERLCPAPARAPPGS